MLINKVGKAEIQLYQNNSKAAPYDPDAVRTPAGTVEKVGKNSTVHFETAKIAAKIVEKYQVRNSTAKEISTMSGELFGAGVISFDEHQALAYQREFHFEYFSLAEKYPDMDLEATPKRDFVEIWQKTSLLEMENKNYRKAATASRIANILENLQQIGGNN